MEGFDDSIFDSVRKATQATELGFGSLPRAAEAAQLSQAVNARQRYLSQAKAAPSLMVGPQPAAAPVANGQWKLGKAPTHYGYAGMQAPAKDWVLRTLGQFPQLRFTSGLRSAAANAAANGAKNSGHMRGWKADFVADRKTMEAAAAWLRQYGAKTLLHDAGSGYHLDVSYEGIR